MTNSLELSVPAIFTFGKVGSILVMCLMVFGTVGNSMLIYVTTKSVNLRGACNYLIALQALTDVITVCGHPIYLYLSWAERLVSFRTCFWLQFVPCSGMHWSTMLVFFVGFDRLLCVRYPLWYATTNKKGYLLTICLICFLYDLAVKLTSYFTIIDQLTLCVIAEAYSGAGKNVFIGSQLCLNVSVIAVYMTLRKDMKLARMLNQIRIKETAKVYKALNTVMMCYILGWLTTMFSLGITMMFTMDVFVTVAVESIAGIFANVNLACPIVVYYFRSSLYCSEIRKAFGLRGLKVTVATSSLALQTTRSQKSYTVGEQN